MRKSRNQAQRGRAQVAEPAAARESGKRRMVADVGRLSVATAFSQALSIVGGLVFARLLDPIGMGWWKNVQMVLDLTAFSNGGTVYGIDRQCPSMVSQHHTQQYRQHVWSSMVLNQAIALAIAGGFIVLATQYADWQMARTAYLAIAVLVALQPFFQHAEAGLSAERAFTAKSWGLVLYTVVRVGLGIVAAWLFGLGGALAIYALAVAWAGWFMWTRSNIGWRVWFDGRMVRTLMAGGIPITAMVLAERLLLNADKWVVLGAMGTASLGIYNIATFPINVLLFVPSSLRQVVSIDVYEKAGRTGRSATTADRGSADTHAKSVMAIALTTPVVVGAVWFGVPWIVATFLPKFVESIWPLQLHALLIYPIIVSQTALPMVVVGNRTGRAVAAMLGVTAAASVASWVWARHGGGGMTEVLMVHGAAWLAIGGGLVWWARRWQGEPATAATRHLLLTMAPMVLLAVELPALTWALAAAGLVPNTLLSAALGGLVHLGVCAPLLWVLEKQTRALSHLGGRVLARRTG